MKKQCQFCGTPMSDSEERCPSCGASNPDYRAPAVPVQTQEPAPEPAAPAPEPPKDFTPTTIEELRQWYHDRNLPPEETTRFFIGTDYRQPRAFGIYEENGTFTVYKNKDDGTRAIRYQGPDEAFAVNELWLRLKSEIQNQKSLNGAKGKPGSGVGCASSLGIFMAGIMTAVLYTMTHSLLFLWMFLLPLVVFLIVRLAVIRKPLPAKVSFVALAVFVVLFFVSIAVSIVIGTSVSYYRYDGNVYAQYQDDYYIYDAALDDYDYVYYYQLPDELTEDPDAYAWDLPDDSDVIPFTDSGYYEDNLASSDSSSSDSDWDSSDSWDSGGTDFSSDW